MQIEKLASPSFILNENGNVSVLLPEFSGEPEAPSLSATDAGTLFFKRSGKDGCRLTDIPGEVMNALAKVDKCLVIELDLGLVADLYEKDDGNLETAFKKFYEADVIGVPAGKGEKK